MLTSLATASFGVLLVVFVLAGGAVWLAGIRLSETTDALSIRWGLGHALAGLTLLAIATDLPEVAIVASAAAQGDLGIAIGNLLGGVAIQTAVLAVLDAAGSRGREPLIFRASSLVLVIEGALVIALLAVPVMGSQLPPALLAGRVTPDGVLTIGVWVTGIWLVARSRRGLPWNDHGAAPGSASAGCACPEDAWVPRAAPAPVRLPAATFALAAGVTLVAGAVLEQSGRELAARLGMDGLLFGATVLAAVTALPEVSTGLAAVRLGDDQLVVSDVFGGNAFLPVLLVLGTALSGKSAVAATGASDLYLTGLGILLTVIYCWALIVRPRRQVLGMGIDSFVVLVLYILGIAGLATLL